MADDGADVDTVVGQVSRLREEGERAVQSGDFDAAEVLLVRALRTVDKDYQVLLVDLYRDLARLCSFRGRFQQAGDLMRAADGLRERLEPQTDLSVANLQRLVKGLRLDPDRRAELGSILFYLAHAERSETGAGPSRYRQLLEEAAAIGMELSPSTKTTVERRAALAIARAWDGDMPGAFELADELRDRLRSDDPGAASVLMRSLAQLQAQSGDLGGGAETAREALELAVEGGNPGHHAAAMSALGFMHGLQGDRIGAVERFREALTIFDHEPRPSVPSATNLVRLGEAERQLGALDVSVDRLSRAVEILRQLTPGGFELGEALDNLSQTHRALGHLGLAVASLRESLPLTPSEPERVRRAIILGDLHKDLGRYDDAQRLIDRAYRDARALGDYGLIVSSLMVMAGIYRWQGDPANAERLYRELLDSELPDVVQEAQALANLGGIYYDRREYVQAENCYREALALLGDDQSGGSSGTPELTHNLAGSLEGQGRLAEADELYVDALARFSGQSRIAVEALSGRARIAERTGRLDDAVELRRQAIDISEQLRSEAGGAASRTALFARLLPHYTALLHLLELRRVPGDLEYGLSLAEMCRARALEERLGEDVAASKSLRYAEQLLHQRLASTSRRLLNARANPKTSETVLQELRRQEWELSAELDGLDQAPGPRTGLQLMTSVEIQEALPENALLLEFQVVNHQMYLWLVSSESLNFEVLEVDVGTLNVLIGNIVAPYHSDEGPTAHDSTGWEAVRNVVCGPVQRLLRKGVTIYVSPDGPLHFISFEPLFGGHPIVYVPSATVALRERPPRVPRGVDADFVGFGNPTFDRSLPEFADLADLPGAEIEVDEISALFGERSVTLCGSRATEGEVRSWARRCRYLHLAAHGFVDVENPMRSGIVLASSGPPRTDRARHDDVLHSYEMINLRIEAELVVCAACRTGFGDERAGEGLATIGSALLQGGARWVLVTLWPVGDLVTATFMRMLYEALVDGVDVPEAVALARDEIRVDHPEPYWWGPFVLFGGRK